MPNRSSHDASEYSFGQSKSMPGQALRALRVPRARSRIAAKVRRTPIAGGDPSREPQWSSNAWLAKNGGAESSDRNSALFEPPGVHSQAPASLVASSMAARPCRATVFRANSAEAKAGFLPTRMREPKPPFAGLARAGRPAQTIQSRQQSWLSAVVGVSYMRPILQVNRSPPRPPVRGDLPQHSGRPPSDPWLSGSIASYVYVGSCNCGCVGKTIGRPAKTPARKSAAASKGK
jgi:hypothetical protein